MKDFSSGVFWRAAGLSAVAFLPPAAGQKELQHRASIPARTTIEF